MALHIFAVNVKGDAITREVALQVARLLNFPQEITAITDQYLEITKPYGRWRLHYNNHQVTFSRTECVECYKEYGLTCGERNICIVPTEEQCTGATNIPGLKSAALFFFSKVYSILEGRFPSDGCDVNQQVLRAIDFSCNREHLKLITQQKTEILAPNLIKVTRTLDSTQADRGSPDASALKGPTKSEVHFLFKLLLFIDASPRSRLFVTRNFALLLESNVEQIVGCNFFTEKIPLETGRAAKTVIWAFELTPVHEFLQEIHYKGGRGAIFVLDVGVPAEDHQAKLRKLHERIQDLDLPHIIILLGEHETQESREEFPPLEGPTTGGLPRLIKWIPNPLAAWEEKETLLVELSRRILA